MGEAQLEFVHAGGAAGVNDTLGIAHGDVFALYAEADVEFGAGDARGSGAVEDDLDLIELLASDLDGVQQGGAANYGGSVLVIVEDGDLHRLFETLFNVEAFGRLDVFQVDSAERRFEQLTDLDHIFRILWN